MDWDAFYNSVCVLGHTVYYYTRIAYTIFIFYNNNFVDLKYDLYFTLGHVYTKYNLVSVIFFNTCYAKMINSNVYNIYIYHALHFNILLCYVSTYRSPTWLPTQTGFFRFQYFMLLIIILISWKCLQYDNIL